MVQVRKKDGTISQSTVEAARAVSDFYNELYASASGTLQASLPRSLDRPITADELRTASARTKGSTTPGVDGIPSGVTKACAPLVSEQLAALINRMFAENKFSKDMLHSN